MSERLRRDNMSTRAYRRQVSLSVPSPSHRPISANLALDVFAEQLLTFHGDQQTASSRLWTSRLLLNRLFLCAFY